MRQQLRKTNWAQMPWHRGFDVCRIGYRGEFMGGNGNPYFPFQIETGDHEEIALPQNQNLDNAYLWQYLDNPAPFAPKTIPTAKMYDAQGRFVDKGGKDSSQLRYSEDIYREEAVAFMRANKDKPFFLYYATPLVHGPLAVKELGRFKDKPAEWTYPHKLWAAMIEELDRSVGILLDEVKRLGLEKNTIIIFASDNGYAAWGYFRRPAWQDDPLFKNKGPWNRGKFITTNGGVIVPFIAWGPGRVPAGKTDRAINFYDFMATAGELAGAKLPGLTDGVSFVPLLEGRDKDQPVRAAMVWPRTTGHMNLADDWNPAAKPGKQPVFPCPDAALLDEKWYAIQLGKTIRLFDITTDPGMKHDLSVQHPDLCAALSPCFNNSTPRESNAHEKHLCHTYLRRHRLYRRCLGPCNPCDRCRRRCVFRASQYPDHTQRRPGLCGYRVSRVQRDPHAASRPSGEIGLALHQRLYHASVLQSIASRFAHRTLPDAFRA